MKYGLPKEDRSKKKWLIAMENELKCLKTEVFLLKEKLDVATDKITQLTANNRPGPFSFFPDLGKNYNPFSHNVNNINNIQRNEEQCTTFKKAFNSFTPFGDDIIGKGTRAVRYRPTKLMDFGREFGSGIVCITAMPEYETRSLEELRLEDYSIAARYPQEHFVKHGTERPRYQVTCDYDPVTGNPTIYHSITCMPRYTEKSFEELRFEDYILKGIGFSNQIQRYKDCVQRSSRTEERKLNVSWNHKNYQWQYPVEKKNAGFVIPHWTLPPPPAHNITIKTTKSRPNPETSHQPESSAAVNSAPAGCLGKLSSLLEELRKCEPLIKELKEIEARNNPNIGDLANNDKSISRQALSELSKLGEQMSTMNNCLNKMDSTISNVSSRVSVMDSRLSAIDMFVTMQRFDKKWQDLETKLTSLQGSPAVSDTTLPLSRCITPGEKQKNTSANDEEMIAPQTSKSERMSCGTEYMKRESDSLSVMDTSEMKLSEFVKSISCISTTPVSQSRFQFSLPDKVDLSYDSSNVSKTEETSFEMSDLKSVKSATLLHPLIQNVNPGETKTINSNSLVVSSTSAESDEQINEDKSNKMDKVSCSIVASVESKTIPENNLADRLEPQISSGIDSNIGTTKSNSEEGVMKKEGDPSITETNDFFQKENDLESDYVMIDKLDIDNFEQESFKGKDLNSSSGKTSTTNEFKMYSDITEYLEVNLGKKKNLVYEFGFEAKPDSFLSVEFETNKGNEKKVNESQDSVYR